MVGVDGSINAEVVDPPGESERIDGNHQGWDEVVIGTVEEATAVGADEIGVS
jgi:hypothetical protein